MKIVRLSLYIGICLCLSSCTRLSYYLEQGLGQIKIQSKAKDNNHILSDPIVSLEYKRKIKFIGDLKKFFYSYFDKKESYIYNKTTMLDTEAVTYLVIASDYDKINPKLECFFIVGCFPYIGFFNQSSAEKYISGLQEEDYVTWKRPIYAYSTLGYFQDPILSSFLNGSDFDTAELIFHELFHTIFFIKNEGELNENLANFFGVELAMIYFNYDIEEKKLLIDLRKKNILLRSYVASFIPQINQLYELKRPHNKSEAQKILNLYLKDEFYPKITQQCKNLEIEPHACFPLYSEWNNAKFAAFYTYEGKSDHIRKLQQKHHFDIKEFYNYLVRSYDLYKNSNSKESFSEFLFPRNLENTQQISGI